MKRGVLFLIVLFLVMTGIFLVIACKKGSGILAPGYVIPTPTPTLTPDVNYMVYLHQEGTPVTGVKLTLKNYNQTLQTKTDNKGTGGFKVNEYGKWSLMVDTFDDFSPQIFIVEPASNTFFVVNYGIPSLELNLLSGNEQIPVAPSSITYTVKYHTKFERSKKILINFTNIDGLTPDISLPQKVANEGDELTIRLDIKKSFEGYTRNKKYLDIYAYTQGTSSEEKVTTSNTRTLTKNWMFNVTADYYFMTLFAFDRDDGKTCYYAGIKNVDVSKSSNIPFYGILKYEIKEFTTYNSGNNTTVYKGLSDTNMPGFTYYECCNFSYGSFNALAKIKTGREENWAWEVGMGANGYIKVRFYDDLYFDVVRTFQTTNGWSQVYYHWCCTSRDISRASCTCKNGLSEDSCILWDSFRCADITRYRRERINITE